MTLLTEQEARDKFCPFAANFSANQQIAEGPGPSCIASECMAWRWDEQGNEDAMDYYEAVAPKDVPCQPPELYGYCGLVGKPEEAA